MSVSVNEVLLEHGQDSLVYILSIDAFVLQQQKWVTVTKTIWLTKPKLFTIWPFNRKSLPTSGLNPRRLI